MIKPLLARLDDNDLVFGGNEDPEKSAVTEQQCFRRVTDLLGLGKERRRSNLRHFTIHSLRSFTFTQFTKTHNADLAHAYIGREQYLDTYLNMPEDEQLEYFLKVEPLLFINEAEPETEAVIQLRKDIEEVKIDSQKKLIEMEMRQDMMEVQRMPESEARDIFGDEQYEEIYTELEKSTPDEIIEKYKQRIIAVARIKKNEI